MLSFKIQILEKKETNLPVYEMALSILVYPFLKKKIFKGLLYICSYIFWIFENWEEVREIFLPAFFAGMGTI